VLSKKNGHRGDGKSRGIPLHGLPFCCKPFHLDKQLSSFGFEATKNCDFCFQTFLEVYSDFRGAFKEAFCKLLSCLEQDKHPIEALFLERPFSQAEKVAGPLFALFLFFFSPVVWCIPAPLHSIRALSASVTIIGRFRKEMKGVKTRP